MEIHEVHVWKEWPLNEAETEAWEGHRGRSPVEGPRLTCRNQSHDAVEGLLQSLSGDSNCDKRGSWIYGQRASHWGLWGHAKDAAVSYRLAFLGYSPQTVFPNSEVIHHYSKANHHWQWSKLHPFWDPSLRSTYLHTMRIWKSALQVVDFTHKIGQMLWYGYSPYLIYYGRKRKGELKESSVV